MTLVARMLYQITLDFSVNSAFWLTDFSADENVYEFFCSIPFIKNTPLNPLCDLRPVLSTLERSQCDF